mgnify:CR=1 FL=1
MCEGRHGWCIREILRSVSGKIRFRPCEKSFAETRGIWTGCGSVSGGRFFSFAVREWLLERHGEPKRGSRPRLTFCPDVSSH